RPHRLTQRTHSARELLAQHGAGGVHQPRTAGQRTHGAARHLGHGRGEPDRAAVRQPDERPGVPAQAAAQAPGCGDRSRGPIDRIGSPNERIQLVNFWPNMELEEYINLEQRVSGRMVLLDISATGEENLIEQQSGNPMNDLEYRRKQLLKLQDAVIDLEDLSTGVSIADLTLTDFRIDLAEYRKAHPGVLESVPLGAFAVTTTSEAEIPPGIVFCLRAEGAAAARLPEEGYPLAPHYLVHVADDGAVLLA